MADTSFFYKEDPFSYEKRPSNAVTIVIFSCSESGSLHLDNTKILLLQRAHDPYGKPSFVVRFLRYIREVLLKKPSRHYPYKYGGYWELLGGFGKPYEDPLKTASRELKEETKLTLFPSYFGVYFFVFRGKEHGSRLYVCYADFERSVRLSKEHSGSKWVSLREALCIELAYRHNAYLEKILMKLGDYEVKTFIEALRESRDKPAVD